MNTGLGRSGHIHEAFGTPCRDRGCFGCWDTLQGTSLVRQRCCLGVSKEGYPEGFLMEVGLGGEFLSIVEAKPS